MLAISETRANISILNSIFAIYARRPGAVRRHRGRWQPAGGGAPAAVAARHPDPQAAETGSPAGLPAAAAQRPQPQADPGRAPVLRAMPAVADRPAAGHRHAGRRSQPDQGHAAGAGAGQPRARPAGAGLDFLPGGLAGYSLGADP